MQFSYLINWVSSEKYLKKKEIRTRNTGKNDKHFIHNLL